MRREWHCAHASTSRRTSFGRLRLALPLGLVLLYGAIVIAAPWVAARYGLTLGLGPPAAGEWILLTAVLGASLLASLVPALQAYRYSLADGMTIRI